MALVSSLEQPQDESLDPIYVYNKMQNHISFLDCASKAFQLGSSSVLWLSPSPEHSGLGSMLLLLHPTALFRSSLALPS